MASALAHVYQHDPMVVLRSLLSNQDASGLRGCACALAWYVHNLDLTNNSRQAWRVAKRSRPGAPPAEAPDPPGENLHRVIAAQFANADRAQPLRASGEVTPMPLMQAGKADGLLEGMGGRQAHIEHPSTSRRGPSRPHGSFG
jgi:hypothetical protein